MAKLIKIWLPTVLWMLVIFLFSTLTTIKTTEIYWGDFIVKKLAHVVEYGVLATLMFRSLTLSGYSRGKSAVWAILISVFYGITDEFHQSFTPGREPKLRDVLFDTIGATLAIYSIWNLLPKAPEKLKNLAKNWQLL